MCVCVPRYVVVVVVVVVVVAASVISTSFHAPRLERRENWKLAKLSMIPGKKRIGAFQN